MSDSTQLDRTSARHGLLLHGNNLEWLKKLEHEGDMRECIQLVYMDPPFGTGRDFGAYSDKWEGGRHELVRFLKDRFEAIFPLISSQGSILVHLDQRIAHLVAVLLDDIFGPGDREPQRHSRPGFRNELIWSYGLGGSSPKCYPRKHDTILWYSKGDSWTFHPPMIPAQSARMRGQMKKQPDVLQIATLNNMAVERVGYPTQKPLSLLRLLVCAHSNEGDLVMDPFCGSGTTLVAALENKRGALGIDANLEAIKLARRRMDQALEASQKKQESIHEQANVQSVLEITHPQVHGYIDQ